MQRSRKRNADNISGGAEARDASEKKSRSGDDDDSYDDLPEAGTLPPRATKADKASRFMKRGLFRLLYFAFCCFTLYSFCSPAFELMNDEAPAPGWRSSSLPTTSIALHQDLLSFLDQLASSLEPRAQTRASAYPVGTYRAGCLFVFVRSVLFTELCSRFLLLLILSCLSFSSVRTTRELVDCRRIAASRWYPLFHLT